MNAQFTHSIADRPNIPRKAKRQPLDAGDHRAAHRSVLQLPLVTGDKDLLALAGAYPILSPADFVGRFVPQGLKGSGPNTVRLK